MNPTSVSPAADTVDTTPRESSLIEREPSDLAFVADLLGLDDDEVDSVASDDDSSNDEHDEVVEVEHRSAPVSEDDQGDAVITEDHVAARGGTTVQLADDRAAIEARILDSDLPVTELIEHEVTQLRKQVKREITGIDPDEVNIDGINVVESLRGQVVDLRRRLEHAVTLPSDWSCPRKPDALVRFERWRRLRLLQAVGGLRGCLQCIKVTWGEPPMVSYRWQSCELHAKRHRGWTLSGARVEKVEDPCQRGELRALSMKLGGLGYYEQFRLKFDPETGELVPPPEWPAESSKVGRGMVGQLWRRFRSGQHDQEPRSYPDAPQERGPSAVSDPTPLGAGRAAAAWRKRPDHVVHSEPTTITEEGAPAVIETMLPESLLKYRDEIGDHGLWFLNLLRTPLDPDKLRDRRAKAEAKQGWHRVSTKKLRLVLGKVSSGPLKRTQRADLLLGTREAPGLLERLGLVERLSDYSSGYKSQGYRLVRGMAKGKLVDVTLVLRKRTKNLPATKRVVGPPVPTSIKADYARLRLDVPAMVLPDLCAAAGIEFSSDLDAISAALPDSPEAVVFKAAIEMLRPWLSSDAAAEESRRLYRDASGHRLQSSFARLPRAIRKHVTFDDGRPLVGLDIRASQLVIGAGRLRAEGRTSDPSIAKWADACETDDIYAVLFELQHERRPVAPFIGPDGEEIDEREEFKSKAFADIIYCAPTWMKSHKNVLARAVEREFPGFYLWLLKEKQRVGHDAYCCDNQRFESKIVLDQLAPLLAAAGIPVATVHDCIYVRDVDTAKARELFEGVLVAVGVRAVVR